MTGNPLPGPQPPQGDVGHGLPPAPAAIPYAGQGLGQRLHGVSDR